MTGICGAALILAGRTHGFHIKPSDIVGVVKIGSDTIKKRFILISNDFFISLVSLIVCGSF